MLLHTFYPELTIKEFKKLFLDDNTQFKAANKEVVVATVTTEILSYALTHPSPPFTIQQPARIIMSGPPGSGKTFAAKNMVQLSCFEGQFEHIYVHLTPG